MRRHIPLLLGAAFVALTVAACEGPTGPAGPRGEQGEPGPPGAAGPAGADAMNTCVQCHGNDATLVAYEAQYRRSAHFNSVYYHREGACMACHNHQGFITTAVNGQPLPAYFDNPAPINCRTCHKVHTTYTGADYAFTTTASVDLIVGATANLGGSGNLCVNCHQIRSMSPMPQIGGSPVTISASAAGRYGPHYGTQGNIAAAQGALHFTGTGMMTIPTSPNAHGQAGCSTCHMVRPTGGNYPYAGGHTFRLSWEDNGRQELVRSCTQCHFHANTTTFNDRNAQAYTKAQLDELRGLLIARGVMNENGTIRAGTHNADLVAAYINHRIFYYDGSYGVHHPQYAFAVLNNTIVRVKQIPVP
jgi:hypothetical protein